MIPLRFGPLGPAGASIGRSGIRWLHPDGHDCRAGEIVAYCSLTVTTDAGPAFADELRDVQVAFAPRCAGRLRHGAEPWAGGYVDRVPIMRWDADAAWGAIEPRAPPPPDAGLPDLMFLAGRRFVDFAEGRPQLLTGWHDRTRAWWGEGPPVTLLAGGTCEQRSMLQGDDGAFLPMFGETAGPLHVVLVQDEPQVPCTRTLLEGIDRTPAEARAIREDLARGMLGGPDPPEPPDWLFAGALLNALERCPIGDHYPVLTRQALLRAPPADVVLLSLTAEMPRMLRHRRLGYTLNCHPFRLTAASRGIRRWLAAEFEIVARTVADVQRDMIALRARLADQTVLMVINAVATSNLGEIGNYALLDAETFAALGPRRAAALNLMLHDIARDHDIAIVDADAQAAALGVAIHLPDGVHASRALDEAVRGELLEMLSRRGFANPALN